MNKPKHVRLVFQALYEIVLYEAICWIQGSGCILRRVRGQLIASKPAGLGLEQAISDAVHFASCLYWKPVLCMQRSACMVRLLRRHGVPARLVIGYRPSPFFCHAWVEVDGRVVSGSPAYQKRLQPLHVA